MIADQRRISGAFRVVDGERPPLGPSEDDSPGGSGAVEQPQLPTLRLLMLNFLA